MFVAPSYSLYCSYQYHRLLQIYPSPSSFALIPTSGRRRPHSAATARAKFDKFDADNAKPSPASAPMNEAAAELWQELDEDSDLPSDLEGAIRQSSQASAAFINSGGMRGMVELLIPQLQFLDAEGAQGELWELSRIFLETLIEETGIQKVRAIFPDAGAAALLKYQWGDAKFGFASLSDRRPVKEDDEVIVMLVPDYQMLEYVERIASQLSADPPRPLIMWNPRLVSEDVGVGFNARKLRRSFLSTFTVAYSMRPLPSGAIFRCYPGLWKIFYDDVNRPNRYLLAKEQLSRPDATDIEQIFVTVSEKSEESPSLFGKAMGMFTSLNRFMRAISRSHLISLNFLPLAFCHPHLNTLPRYEVRFNKLRYKVALTGDRRFYTIGQDWELYMIEERSLLMKLKKLKLWSPILSLIQPTSEFLLVVTAWKKVANQV